jgi:hypothetical protein
MSTLSLSKICSPLWATPRTPSRPSDGRVAAQCALALNRPLIPWQRRVADVAGERDPDTGRLAYSTVVVIAPRRAGKSMLMLSRGLANMRARSARGLYLSAHREAAARMWRDDWFPTIEDAPLGRFTRLVWGNGQEAVRWRPGLGPSTFRLIAASGAAIRSAASRLVIIDEARDISPERGADLEGAAFPTRATITGGAQTWILSSAGDASSVWLARWRDMGRAAVAAGKTNRLAYFEYAAPADADPDDEATWWQAHPGLGHQVDLEALRDDFELMTPDQFRCEYLGWWPESLADSTLIDAWAAAPAVAQLVDPVVFAVEVDEDRTTASIVAVGTAEGGRLAVELVEHRPHGPWVAPRLMELCERWDPIALTFDAGGPAAALTPDLANVPTRIMPLQTREATAAAGAFYDAVVHTGGICRVADVELDAAIAAGRRRRSAGAWLFDRRTAGAGPLIAATLAVWVHRGNGTPPTVT